MFEQHTRSDCDQKIRVGYSDLVRAFDFGGEFFPIFVERDRIDFTRDKKVRNGLSNSASCVRPSGGRECLGLRGWLISWWVNRKPRARLRLAPSDARNFAARARAAQTGDIYTYSFARRRAFGESSRSERPEIRQQQPRLGRREIPFPSRCGRGCGRICFARRLFAGRHDPGNRWPTGMSAPTDPVIPARTPSAGLRPPSPLYCFDFESGSPLVTRSPSFFSQAMSLPVSAPSRERA